MGIKRQLGLGSMKFAPGTPRSVAEAALIRAGYPAPRRPGPKSFVMDTRGVDPGSYDAFPRATDYAPGVSAPKTPKKNNYGTAIDLPPGSAITQVFLDSDRDGVDDRFQTGPGMPDSRGVKPPGKTIIDKGTSNNRSMSSSYRSVKDSGFDPAAYGNPDIGLKDVYELRKRGFNRKEIQDYVDYKKKGGMNIGARVQGGLSLMGTQGDKKGSIADSGYSYKDFGDGKGVGFHDLVELTGRGYGKQAISDYIEGQRKQGTTIGGAVSDLMGLVGPVGGRDKKPETPVTPTPTPTKVVNKEVSSGNKGQGAGSTVDNRINIKAAPAMKAPAAAPMAGAKFGLAPTEVVEQTRGRGYGLTYSPQQRDAQTVKYGGGPQNVINFNPNMVQQANPNINVAGSKAINKPTTTNTNITESGKGGIDYAPGGSGGSGGGGGGGGTAPGSGGGGNQPGAGGGNQPGAGGGNQPGGGGGNQPGGGGGKNYRKKMNRYMRTFDRTAEGAGSKKGTDRFSAKDIRTMFKAGRKRGGSKKQVARDVLAYARRNRKKTKMGGKAKAQLDKLQRMLGARRKEEKKRKSMTAKQQRKLDRKQRKRAKKKVRKYLKRRRNKRKNR